jgi:hypothetical protein
VTAISFSSVYEPGQKLGENGRKHFSGEGVPEGGGGGAGAGRWRKCLVKYFQNLKGWSKKF